MNSTDNNGTGQAVNGTIQNVKHTEPLVHHAEQGERTERHPRIAVFASGTGSNFQALVDAFQAEPARYGGDIALLVCDKPQAYIVKRAEAAGVPAACFTPKAYSSREQYEEDVLLKLHEERIDWIVLAGYMRLVTPVLLRAYGGRMLNIHPSLLPAFPGLNAVKQALDYGVRVTGVTVHLVDEGMDTGPILAQRAVLVEENDTEETLAARIHAAEHALYPTVVAEVVAGRLKPRRAAYASKPNS